MPLNHIIGEVRKPVVKDPESMLELIEEYRIVPFFANPIPGFSVEEHTPADHWFESDDLGPWDWKIDCLQSGDVAYGKFLWGGKAAFATVDVYRELMNWRRSQARYEPTEVQRKVLDLMEAKETISVADVRKLLGITKSAADAILTKLQMQARVITGDITRVFRGPELSYVGWQRSVFCAPEALFEGVEFPFPGYVPRTLGSSLSPAESLEYVKQCVRKVCGDVPDKVMDKLLR